jgi:hypothetical protein
MNRIKRSSEASSRTSLPSRSVRTLALLLGSLLVFGVPISGGSLRSQAEFFDDAFSRAAVPPIGGSGWVVTAKLNMNAPGKEYISAIGRVTLQPDATLGGDLAMSIDNKAVPNNIIRVAIRKSNPAVVVVQRLVAGKPFLGRPGKIVKLPVDPGFNYVSGPVEWSDGTRVLQIFLETEFVKKAAAKPIGARYRVTGHATVTNAEDGPFDSTVEVYGKLVLALPLLPGEVEQRSFALLEERTRNAVAGEAWPFNDVTVDIFDDENPASTFEIVGFFSDQDQESNPDVLWKECPQRYRFSLKERRITCPGDNDTESLDVFVRVVKVQDLYKKF